MESMVPSGLYLLLFLLLVVECHHGLLSFSIYWLQDTKALVVYTCQNTLVEPSNLIESPLQGTNNPTAVCRAKAWCARPDPDWLEGCVRCYTTRLHCRCDRAQCKQQVRCTAADSKRDAQQHCETASEVHSSIVRQQARCTAALW